MQEWVLSVHRSQSRSCIGLEVDRSSAQGRSCTIGLKVDASVSRLIHRAKLDKSVSRSMHRSQGRSGIGLKIGCQMIQYIISGIITVHGTLSMVSTLKGTFGAPDLVINELEWVH